MATAKPLTVQQIKAAVRERDGHRCVECGKPPSSRRLDVHRKIPGSEYTPDGCVTLCRRCHRRRHGCDALGKLRNTKVPADLHRKLKVVARFRGVLLTEYMDQLLTGPVDRDFEQMLREASR